MWLCKLQRRPHHHSVTECLPLFYKQKLLNQNLLLKNINLVEWSVSQFEWPSFSSSSLIVAPFFAGGNVGCPFVKYWFFSHKSRANTMVQDMLELNKGFSFIVTTMAMICRQFYIKLRKIVQKIAFVDCLQLCFCKLRIFLIAYTFVSSVAKGKKHEITH